MKYINNVFSSGMVHEDMHFDVKVVDLETFKSACEGAVSTVGHEDTAKILAGLLNRNVEFNRVSTVLKPGDVVCVAQYDGPRLPLGADKLPDGAKFRWEIWTAVKDQPKKSSFWNYVTVAAITILVTSAIVGIELRVKS